MAQNRIAGKTFSSRSEVIAQNGMVATCQPLATNAALDVLKKGGNAIDAAIAANAMLGLVEPHNCGIGGDLFAIVWDANTQKLYGLNASGRSPKTISATYFKENDMEYIPTLGPLSVSVPGCVDGWDMLHRRFGKLKMNEILQAAIDYGKSGFPVTEIIAGEMKGSANARKTLPGFMDTYMPEGKIPSKGEIFKNTNLSTVYEEIANSGRDAFTREKLPGP